MTHLKVWHNSRKFSSIYNDLAAELMEQVNNYGRRAFSPANCSSMIAPLVIKCLLLIRDAPWLPGDTRLRHRSPDEAYRRAGTQRVAAKAEI